MKKEIIQFNTEIENITFVRSFLANLGDKYHLSRNLIYKVQLAVEEAITNIIRHGYRGEVSGKIRLEIIVRHFTLMVVIIDRGKEFDPRLIDKPDLNQYVQVGKIGGLGIMMIKNLIDDIDYKVTERGNELYLIKYRKNVSFYNLYHQIVILQNVIKRILNRLKRDNPNSNPPLKESSKTYPY